MNTPENKNGKPDSASHKQPSSGQNEERRSAIEEMLKQTYNVEQIKLPKKEAPKPSGQTSAEPPKAAAPRTSSTPTVPANQADMRSLYSTSDPKSSQKKGKSKKASSEKGTSSKKGGTLLGNLMKAIVYVAFVLVVSGFAAYYIITFANDAFAFVKPEGYRDITFSYDPDIDNIAETLKDKGVIEHEGFFKFYAMLRKKDSGFIAKTVSVSPSMNYDSLLRAFMPEKQKREEIEISIPEGKTVDEIIEIFLSHGMGTKEGFVAAINNYDFDYWFVDELSELPEGRKYRLEGYLFPDTYRFFSDWSEPQILDKILSNFEKKFAKEYRARADELKMTVDDVIILASMIQSETATLSEFSVVSSVFHNRINNPSATNGKLESCATVLYVLGVRKLVLSNEDTEIESPYNTYKYQGLPPGAISNPGVDAIHSALYPADTDYYYFVAKGDGTSIFAKTYEEHLRNTASVR